MTTEAKSRVSALCGPVVHVACMVYGGASYGALDLNAVTDEEIDRALANSHDKRRRDVVRENIARGKRCGSYQPGD